MRLNLHSLQLFVATVTQRSIAAAAEREFIAPSALSKRIAELERLFGTPLLVRQARGVEPTAAGRVLVREARTLLHQAQNLEAKIRDFAVGDSGHVRIAANSAAITQFLSEDLRGFTELHPRIQIDLEERVSALVTRMLIENAADVGVFTSSSDEAHLEIHAYREDELVLIMHDSHPLAAMKRISFADTLEHEHIGLQRDSVVANLIQHVATNANRELRMRFFVHSYDALIAMVRSRHGIGLLPRGALVLYDTANVTSVGLIDDWARRRLKVAVRPGEPPSSAARRLLQHLCTSSTIRWSQGSP